VFAVAEHRDAVYEDVSHPNRVLMRPFIRGPVLDGAGVEDDDVGEIAFLQKAPTLEAQIRRGQMAELADRRLESQ
jgi:hypothetical protein